jgi:hypothetical protein
LNIYIYRDAIDGVDPEANPNPNRPPAEERKAEESKA